MCVCVYVHSPICSFIRWRAHTRIMYIICQKHDLSTRYLKNLKIHQREFG